MKVSASTLLLFATTCIYSVSLVAANKDRPKTPPPKPQPKTLADRVNALPAELRNQIGREVKRNDLKKWDQMSYRRRALNDMLDAYIEARDAENYERDYYDVLDARSYGYYDDLD